MRVLVCGGRDYNDRQAVYDFLDRLHSIETIEQVIHGDARGADALAKDWAVSRGVEHWPFPAEWDKYGKGAGTRRNYIMLTTSTPDLVIPFPGGAGTAHMARIARAAGYQVVLPDVEAE